jgi:predicted O-methyltransferase YrrM
MAKPTKGNKRFHWLAYHIKQNGYINTLEIGGGKGKTAKHLGFYFPHINHVVVDPFLVPDLRGASKDATKFFRRVSDLKNVRVIVADSGYAAECFADGSLDLVFIDGDHTFDQVCVDIELWMPKVRRGGLFCGHDTHFQTVADAVDIMVPMRQEWTTDHVWYKFIE